MNEMTQMFREAGESPTVVTRQLAENEAQVRELGERLHRSPPHFIMTGARGSSDHAATFAKYVFETRLGIATASAAPSVSSPKRRRTSAPSEPPSSPESTSGSSTRRAAAWR